MEAEESDFRTLILLFYQVFQFCEGYCSGTDTKLLFKIAKTVEDAYTKLEGVGALESFDNKLNEFWKVKGLKCISVFYFRSATHLVLSRYMSDSVFSDDEVKVAIKLFVLYKSQKEFIEVIQNLNRTRQSIEVLKQNLDLSNLSKYNAIVHLEELTRRLATNNGNAEEILSIIKKHISENSESFKSFLRILCLSNNCELSQSVQELIKISICNILRTSEDSNLYSYILELSDEDFSHIISCWDSLTEVFFEMIESSVKRLQCDYSTVPYCWKISGTEKSLAFNEIKELVNKLKQVSKKSDQLKKLFNNLKETGFVVIAEDLMRICNIK